MIGRTLVSYLRWYCFWAERDILALKKNRSRCGEARRDPDNLNWLASPLVRVSKSWPRGPESESRAWTEQNIPAGDWNIEKLFLQCRV